MACEQMPKISIIVPIYNVERFLDKCVDSIVNQTYQNIEIILVDDASPDRCNQMADAYALVDERIQVIHQHNKWLGGARNSGIKYATGDYILFVDSDDYIRLDMCEKLMAYIKEHDVDMVIFDTQHVDGEYQLKSISSPPIKPNHVYAGNDVQDTLYPLIISTHCVNSACMKLYKTFIHGEKLLLFDEQIRYAEDYEYCLRLFPKLTSFVHCDEAFYYYVVNDESIMNKADSLIIDKFITLFDFRERFLERQHLDTDENKKKSANLLVTMVIKNLPKYLGDSSYNKARKLIKDIFHKERLYDAIEQIDKQALPLGRMGRLALWGIEHKNMTVVYWTEKGLIQ